nr:CopG family transcriptional regulator [Moritella viscosa]
MKIKPDAVRKNSTIRMYEDLLEKLESISEQCNVSKSQFVEGMLVDVFENGMDDLLLGTGIITVHLSNKITKRHVENVLIENYPKIKNTLYVETDNDETEITVNLNGNEFSHNDITCMFHSILNKMVNLIDC